MNENRVVSRQRGRWRGALAARRSSARHQGALRRRLSGAPENAQARSATWRALISVSNYARIPTARDAPSAIVISEMSAWSIISSFARAVKGKVSDGENAVALVNAKKR